LHIRRRCPAEGGYAEGRREEGDNRGHTYDWFTDPTIGPVIAEAAEEAAAQARAEALIAEQRILRRQTEKRFGTLPEAVVARIAAMSLTELEDFSLRVLDAASLDEMFS
jgi:hypothetical protein